MLKEAMKGMDTGVDTPPCTGRLRAQVLHCFFILRAWIHKSCKPYKPPQQGALRILACQTDRQTHRQTDRQTDCLTDTQTHRQTDRQAERVHQ